MRVVSKEQREKRLMALERIANSVRVSCQIRRVSFHSGDARPPREPYILTAERIAFSRNRAA